MSNNANHKGANMPELTDEYCLEHANADLFQVGDKVVVRTDLTDDLDFGPSVVRDMLDYRGQEMTIQHVHPDSYTLEECPFYWADYMFVPPETEDPVTAEEFEGMLV